MNIVTATFSSGCCQVAADEKLWQWDQGQILQIVGLDLPDAYQVEFSNQPVRGTAAPMIGGVGGVEIPDVYLTTGKPVYAFVVLHAGEDDRETEYKITIPVNARPQPTDVQPTPEQQSVIDQLIAALNAGVEKAEDAADEAEGAADDAAAQAQAAAQSASSSASYAGDAAAQAGLAAAAKAGAEAAQAAAELAQGSAEAFATAAGVAKAAAETAQGKAEDAQAAAETAQAAAESAKAGALAAKAAAETAQGKAEDAQEAAEQAAQDAHVEYDLLAGQVTAQGQTIAQHGQAIAQNTADIADLDTELTQQKSAIDDLTDLTNRKAGMLVDTASRSIASFVPDATVPNLLGVSVDIEPVQAGSGDPSPDNVRPISGWDAVEVNHSGADTSDPTTYTITLGQTVYGGTLDVTNGTLMVDRAMITLDGSNDEAWSVVYQGRNNQYFRSPVGEFGFIVDDDVLSNIYTRAVISTSTTVVGINIINSSSYNVSQISVRPVDVSSMTIADFRAQLAENPLQVVYRLSTPIVFDLDPVTISTISGQTNNVWADAGDVVVTYAADIKAYIDRLNPPTEDDMIANSLISANKYFTVNNRLFLSTASIAAGAQIIPGHNCTETSLVEALNALNA